MNEYYTNQVRGGHVLDPQSGGGIVGFQGIRYHGPVSMKGYGFFGRVIKGGIVPLLAQVGKYLGSKAKQVMPLIAADIAAGQSFKTMVKRAGKRTAKHMLYDAGNAVDIKEGEGIARPKRSKRQTPNIIKVTAKKGIKDTKRKIKKKKSKSKKTSRRQKVALKTLFN